MPETYPCPNKMPNMQENCLGRQWIEGTLFPLIRTASARALAFQVLMAVPEVNRLPAFINPPAGYPVVDCVYTGIGHPPVNPNAPNVGEFYGLGSYVKMIFDTGYAVKQVKDGAGVLWTLPPATKEDVEALEACDAFWTGWNEIYDCLQNDALEPLDKAARDRMFVGCSGCMEYKQWNDFYLMLECLANYKCFPTCNCIICDTASCIPCNKCITVQIGFGAYWALVDSVTSATTGCVYDFAIVNEPFRDVDGVVVPNLTMSASVHLVKSYVMWTIYINDSRTVAPGDPPVVSTHQVEMDYTTEEGPSNLCEDLNDIGMLVDGRTISIYVYDDDVDPPTTTLSGEIMVSMQSGFPICARPWQGTNKYYEIDMTTVPVCINCGASADPETDGRMQRSGAKLVLTNSAVSHLSRGFYAEVEFDNTLCTYRMIISCFNGGDIVWEGLQIDDCGGPEGYYGTDPLFVNPCFTSIVKLNGA